MATAEPQPAVRIAPSEARITKLEPPTVAEYFQELLDHFGHLEGKLWRTLGTLFFQPGKLPQDYLANKRARYVKPLKLYLAAIALAFAAVQFLGWDLKALTADQQLAVARERGIHYPPYLEVVLAPLYAALLQWVYRSRHRRYAAHLVFGLYAHSFLLLIFVIEAKLPLALATMLSMWAIVYYVLSLKRVYGGHGARPSDVALVSPYCTSCPFSPSDCW